MCNARRNPAAAPVRAATALRTSKKANSQWGLARRDPMRAPPLFFNHPFADSHFAARYSPFAARHGKMFIQMLKPASQPEGIQMKLHLALLAGLAATALAGSAFGAASINDVIQ